MKNISQAVLSYLEAALWSSTDENGDPLDDRFSISDLSPEALDRATKDVERFFEAAGDLLDGYDLRTACHDFWLTRNRHGAGFWDGDYQKSDGQALTDLAESFGEIDLCSGDDGALYFFGGVQ